MRCLATYLILCICLATQTRANTLSDSTDEVRHRELAGKMRLKLPALKQGEYEVRIWYDQALRYGDAHLLYVLTKTQRQVKVSKYVIESDKRGFRHAVQLMPSKPMTDSLWNQLVAQSLLTLPDKNLIHNELYPKPPKDSTWNVVEADGIVTVKAKIRRTNWIIIGDGEGYYFEVFSANDYRHCRYDNPRGYLENKPNSVELRKVVTILDKIVVLFRSAN